MMQITDVRIKLLDDPTERLKAFCSLTFDQCFVVRDLKIIDGINGPFVAMPSRKLMIHCPKCRVKNHARSNYCNQCGHRFEHVTFGHSASERVKLYADIAHPINSACREMIQNAVLFAFEEEKIKSQQPGYVCRYDDFSYDDTNANDVYFDHPHGLTEPHHSRTTSTNLSAKPTPET